MPEDQITEVHLITPDGRKTDITELLEEQRKGNDPMATATKSINEAALEKIVGACRERVNEMLDDLLTYVNASNEKGTITLKVSVAPVKDTPGAFWVDVVPSLAVKGMRSEGAATIERVGKSLQLKLSGLGDLG